MNCDFVPCDGGMQCTRCGRLIRFVGTNIKAQCRPTGQPRHRSQSFTAAPFGPGTELAALFLEIQIREKVDCKCKAIAAEMDQAGVAGCRERRKYFLVKLKENAKKYNWREKFRAGMVAGWQGKPLTLSGLYTEAILRAERKEQHALASLVEELKSPAVPRSGDWRHRRDVITAQQLLLDEMVETRHAMPAGFEGRGIVTLGGSAKYFGAAYVLVSVLRRLGCQLPVEWWFLGPEELDPRMLELAEQLGGVQCVNLFERTGKYGRQPRRIGGWEAKAWAIMYSRFAEVLFLDADNVPARDPTYLFNSPEYLRTGTLAWPDFAPEGWSVTEAAFQIARLPVPGKTARPDWRAPTDYRPWETGQLLVAKPHAWHALEVWAGLSDQSDFWYPREYKGAGHWLVYGDKDQAYLAWEATRTSYAMPPDCSFAGSNAAGAFMQLDPAGELVFQHRVQPATKWKLHEENRQVPGSLHHAVCEEALQQLRALWPGQVWDAYDETPAERAAAEQLIGDYVWFHHGEPTRLSLRAGGQIAGGQWHWTLRHHEGEPWLFLSTFDRRVCVLGRDRKDGETWCNHATQDFLMAAPPPDFDLPLRPDEIVIWHEVVTGNEYRLPERFGPNDTVIDVGAHCGMFARACLGRNVWRVISIEPVPENFAKLEANLRPFGENRSLRINAAVWSEEGATVHLEQKPGAHHTGGWSAIGTREGVEAKTVSLDQIVAAAARPIRLVKLDCEGSEWRILAAFTQWDQVEGWCGEYHHTLGTVADSRLRSIFEPHGYQVTVLPHPAEPLLGHFWAYRAS